MRVLQCGSLRVEWLIGPSAQDMPALGTLSAFLDLAVLVLWCKTHPVCCTMQPTGLVSITCIQAITSTRAVWCHCVPHNVHSAWHAAGRRLLEACQPLWHSQWLNAQFCNVASSWALGE